MYFDNANVSDTSISWYEADKKPVITTTCFCTIGKARRLVGHAYPRNRHGKANQQNGQSILLLTWL
jgi:hypothetical protein